MCIYECCIFKFPSLHSKLASQLKTHLKLHLISAPTFLRHLPIVQELSGISTSQQPTTIRIPNQHCSDPISTLSVISALWDCLAVNACTKSPIVNLLTGTLSPGLWHQEQKDVPAKIVSSRFSTGVQEIIRRFVSNLATSDCLGEPVQGSLRTRTATTTGGVDACARRGAVGEAGAEAKSKAEQVDVVGV